MILKDTRGQLTGGDNWVLVVVGVACAIMAYLIWQAVQDLPKQEMQAAMEAAPWWQTALIVMALSAVVAYFYPMPRVRRL